MITPTGSLELSFDELSRPYKVPLFCFCTPTNLISPSTPYKMNEKEKEKDMEKEKDKSLSPVEFHPIHLKIRINPGDYNFNIVASTADTIEDLKHFILTQSLSQQVS